MTEEQIEKKLKTMEVLKLPYDSNEVRQTEVPETYCKNFNARLYAEKEKLSYKISTDSLNFDIPSYKCLLEFTNKDIKNFFMSNPSYGDVSKLSCGYDRFKVIIKLEGKQISYEVNPGHNLPFSEFLIEHVKELPNVPKNINFSVDITRTTNDEYRKYWFEKKRGGSPEKIMDTIFNPTVQKHYIEQGYRKSRYSNPFSSGSLKKKLYEVNKEVMVFAIEFLYGKKVNKSLKSSKIAQILMGLPNSRFCINDVQLAKQLPGKISYCSVKSTYSGLLELGMKPATDLKRWNKKYNLTNEGVN